MRFERCSTRDVLPLRQSVLRPGQPAEASHYPTDNAVTTIHLFAREDAGTVVCVASLALDPAPGELATSVPVASQWRLRGMASAEAVRGTGVAKQLLSKGIELALEAGAQLFWCNARSPAVGFYLAQGWVTVGTEFELPAIGPHLLMTLPMNEP